MWCPLEAGKDKEIHCPRAWGSDIAMLIPGCSTKIQFRPLTSGTVREYICITLSHQNYGKLLGVI